VVLIALALLLFGVFWFVELWALGSPHAVRLRGWPRYPVSSCTYYPAWSDAPYSCPGGR
jgi:hypothetical protein